VGTHCSALHAANKLPTMCAACTIEHTISCFWLGAGLGRWLEPTWLAGQWLGPGRAGVLASVKCFSDLHMAKSSLAQ